jgi:hypothetical protein
MAGLDGVAVIATVGAKVTVADGSFVGGDVGVDACVLTNSMVDVNCGVDDPVSTLVDGGAVPKPHPDAKMTIIRNRQLILILLTAIDL